MKEHILITVKTYPTISQTYGELVCTAGIREDGSWVRLYPVPFRKLSDYDKYQKYQWLSARLNARTQDVRPESFSPEIDSIDLGGVVTTADGWAERCRLVLNKGTVYDNMTELIEMAKNNELSLATYKPTEILDLVVEEVEREWSASKLNIAKNLHRQGDLFADDDQFEEEFKLVTKLPYEFSYRFKDKDGTVRKLMIEDWEIGALYWNCLNAADGDEDIATQNVREKYLHFYAKTDLHLFVGTTLRYHGWASNPFVIIGVFYPPKNRHMELELWN